MVASQKIVRQITIEQFKTYAVDKLGSSFKLYSTIPIFVSVSDKGPTPIWV